MNAATTRARIARTRTALEWTAQDLGAVIMGRADQEAQASNARAAANLAIAALESARTWIAAEERHAVRVDLQGQPVTDRARMFRISEAAAAQAEAVALAADLAQVVSEVLRRLELHRMPGQPTELQVIQALAAEVGMAPYYHGRAQRIAETTGQDRAATKLELQAQAVQIQAERLERLAQAAQDHQDDKEAQR